MASALIGVNNMEEYEATIEDIDRVINYAQSVGKTKTIYRFHRDSMTSIEMERIEKHYRRKNMKAYIYYEKGYLNLCLNWREFKNG